MVPGSGWFYGPGLNYKTVTDLKVFIFTFDSQLMSRGYYESVTFLLDLFGQTETVSQY